MPDNERKSYANPFVTKTHELKRDYERDTSLIESYLRKGKAAVERAAKNLSEEEEDMNLAGMIAQWTTALGCTYLTKNVGACIAAGATVGAGVRKATDSTGDAEESIPGEFTAPETKYFRDKSAILADNLNQGVDALETFEENQFKRQLLGVVDTTLDTLKFSSGMVEGDYVSGGENDPIAWMKDGIGNLFSTDGSSIVEETLSTPVDVDVNLFDIMNQEMLDTQDMDIYG